MSFLSSLCGCFTRSEATPRPSNPEMQTRQPSTNSHNGVQTGRFTLSGEGDFIRPAGHEHGPPPADSEVGGYASVVPLPQYTPRPMSVNEKTLESHLRDPSMSSESGLGFSNADEKNRHLYHEDVSSDASSIISYPSSYGNTSTATRETPPPPYSPRQSVQLTRTRSVSLYSMSSARGITINPPPMARLSGARIGPPLDADDQSIRRHRRQSWESQ